MSRNHKCQRGANAEPSTDGRRPQGSVTKPNCGRFLSLSKTMPLLCALGATALYSQSTCNSVSVSLTPDYQYAIGTSNGGAAFTWTENGQTIAQGPITQLD